MKKILFIFSFFLLLHTPLSFAEPDTILITLSDTMNKIKFDGKWSFPPEWKNSSLDTFGPNKIRTAHQGEFVYVLIDVLSDSTYDKGSDKATLCFDTNNDKSIIPQEDDYCFIAILDGKQEFILQGGSPFRISSHYQKILTHENFIAIGTMSDNNDRYSKTPHTSYEFKIPIEIIGRSNVYGFYLQVFDQSSGQTFTWPENINTNNKIPPTNLWGEIISIDKSLPEFPLPLFFFTILLFSMIIVSKKLNYGRLRINNQQIFER